MVVIWIFEAEKDGGSRNN